MRSCVDFSVFSVGFAILLAVLVIIAPDTFASKPLTGGISASQVIEKVTPPMSKPVQPVGNGYVGLDLTISPNTPPIVNNVFLGSPAAKSGLRSGDVLLTADNVPLSGLTKEAVDDAISNVVGHVIRFQVQRETRVVSVSVKVAAKSTSSLDSDEYSDEYISCLIP
ncbi:MAG: PDZ domain-containing protein [Vampirovibrionales bacterium]|nr:PDZ domain-containing protein [Vampirovibrionales bacterium]